MSSNIYTAKRRSALLLATSILALGSSPVLAQTPPTALPPVEITSPTDPNRTRASTGRFGPWFGRLPRQSAIR